VKYRESFRPFAPAVLREDVADWFELDRDSPYMLLVADVKGRGGAP
jgi:carbamoyltransferase